MDQLLKDTLLGMTEVSRAGLNAGLDIGRREERARAKPLVEALIRLLDATDELSLTDEGAHDEARAAIAAWRKAGK